MTCQPTAHEANMDLIADELDELEAGLDSAIADYESDFGPATDDIIHDLAVGVATTASPAASAFFLSHL